MYVGGMNACARKNALSADLQVCGAIYKWTVNSETNVTDLGDWCKNQRGRKGDPDKFYWVSRPSDYMLTHFKLFSKVGCGQHSHMCLFLEHIR